MITFQSLPFDLHIALADHLSWLDIYNLSHTSQRLQHIYRPISWKSCKIVESNQKIFGARYISQEIHKLTKTDEEPSWVKTEFIQKIYYDDLYSKAADVLESFTLKKYPSLKKFKYLNFAGPYIDSDTSFEKYILINQKICSVLEKSDVLKPKFFRYYKGMRIPNSIGGITRFMGELKQPIFGSNITSLYISTSYKDGIADLNTDFSMLPDVFPSLKKLETNMPPLALRNLISILPKLEKLQKFTVVIYYYCDFSDHPNEIFTGQAEDFEISTSLEELANIPENITNTKIHFALFLSTDHEANLAINTVDNDELFHLYDKENRLPLVLPSVRSIVSTAPDNGTNISLLRLFEIFSFPNLKSICVNNYNFDVSEDVAKNFSNVDSLDLQLVDQVAAYCKYDGFSAFREALNMDILTSFSTVFPSPFDHCGSDVLDEEYYLYKLLRKVVKPLYFQMEEQNLRKEYGNISDFPTECAFIYGFISWLSEPICSAIQFLKRIKSDPHKYKILRAWHRAEMLLSQLTFLKNLKRLDLMFCDFLFPCVKLETLIYFLEKLSDVQLSLIQSTPVDLLRPNMTLGEDQLEFHEPIPFRKVCKEDGKTVFEVYPAQFRKLKEPEYYETLKARFVEYPPDEYY